MERTTVEVPKETLELLRKVKGQIVPEPTNKEYVRYLVEKDAHERSVAMEENA